MFYLLVAVKLMLGFMALLLVINLTGKGISRLPQLAIRCRTTCWAGLSAG